MSRLEVHITKQIETTFTIEKPATWDSWGEDDRDKFLADFADLDQEELQDYEDKEGLQDYETRVVERDFWTRPAGYYVTDWVRSPMYATLYECELRDPNDQVITGASFHLTSTSPPTISPYDQTKMNLYRNRLIAMCDAANKGLEK